MSTQTTFSNDGASSDGAATQEPPELALPSLPDTDDSSTQLVGRTVQWTLWTLGVLLVVAATVGTTVSIDLTVEASGVLEPQEVWPVRAQEAGTVSSLHVQPGDTVSTGQPLVRLDSLSLTHRREQLRAERSAQRLALRRAEAESALDGEQQQYAVARAEASLLRARADLRDRLAAHGLSHDVDSLLDAYTPGQHIGLDRAVSTVRDARASLQTARSNVDRDAVRALDVQEQAAQIQRINADLAQVNARLDRLTLTAPIRGVVLTDRIERLAGRYVSPGDLIVEVAALDDWRVELFAREQAVADVAPGDPVKVEIRAFRDASRELIRGTVTSVAAEPMSDGSATRLASTAAGSGRYRITVALDPSDVDRVGRTHLRHGYTVDGKIITRSGRILSLFWDYLTNAS